MDPALERWRGVALQYLRVWAMKHRDCYFVADRIIMDSRVYGLEQPPDGRCWGQVFQRAAEQKIITWVSDHGKAPHRRLSKTAIWRT